MGIHADDAIDAALDDWVNEHNDERDDYDDVLIKSTPSSNGRTPAFGAENRGSSPCGVTIELNVKIKHKWGKKAWEETLAPDLNSMARENFFFLTNLFDLDEHIPFDSEDW